MWGWIGVSPLLGRVVLDELEQRVAFLAQFEGACLCVRVYVRGHDCLGALSLTNLSSESRVSAMARRSLSVRR